MAELAHGEYVPPVAALDSGNDYGPVRRVQHDEAAFLAVRALAGQFLGPEYTVVPHLTP